MGGELPTVQNTVFGWVETGRAGKSVIDNMFCDTVNNVELDAQLEKFWEQEECQGRLEFRMNRLCEGMNLADLWSGCHL